VFARRPCVLGGSVFDAIAAHPKGHDKWFKLVSQCDLKDEVSADATWITRCDAVELMIAELSGMNEIPRAIEDALYAAWHTCFEPILDDADPYDPRLSMATHEYLTRAVAEQFTTLVRQLLLRPHLCGAHSDIVAYYTGQVLQILDDWKRMRARKGIKLEEGAYDPYDLMFDDLYTLYVLTGSNPNGPIGDNLADDFEDYKGLPGRSPSCVVLPPVAPQESAPIVATPVRASLSTGLNVQKRKGSDDGCTPEQDGPCKRIAP